jgi:hypothetical protein
MSIKNKSLLVRLKPAIFTGELNAEFSEKLYAINTDNAAGIGQATPKSRMGRPVFRRQA